MNNYFSEKNLKYLCCPKCKTNLKFITNNLVCEKCKKYYRITSRIVRIISSFSKDMELSVEKWDEAYKKQLN